MSFIHFDTKHALNQANSIITIGVGLISIYLFPADPSKTRIFNAEQRALAMARLFHDQPAIRDHKEKITWALIKRGVLTPNVLAGAWIYTCNQVSVQGLSIFTVTILRLNYPGLSTVQIQLLSAPPPIAGAAFALCMAYVAMKTRRHGLVIAACAGLNVVGYGIWLGSSNPQARYAAIFLNTGGGFAFGALVLSWTLANAAPDTVRNVANAAVSGLANIGKCCYHVTRHLLGPRLTTILCRFHRRDVELHQHGRLYGLPNRKQPKHGHGLVRHLCRAGIDAVPALGE